MNDLIYYEPFSGQFFECSISEIEEFIQDESWRYFWTNETKPLIDIIEKFCERFCSPIHVDRRSVPYEYFKEVRFLSIQLVLERLVGGIECQKVNWLY